MYPQALRSPSQPLVGTSARYDMAPHASQQPPMCARRPTEFVPKFSVQSADSSFVHQQNPRQIDPGWSSSEGPAGAWNLLAGSCSHQPTSGSRSSCNPGGFRFDFQQNPRPIAASPPSPGSASVQNAWVPFSQDYLNSTFMTARKRKGLAVCNGQTSTEYAY